MSPGKLGYIAESWMYALFLPLHMMNTIGFGPVKLFHIPVVILGLISVSKISFYYRHISVVRYVVWSLIFASLSLIYGGIPSIVSYLTVLIVAFSVFPLINLNKLLFLKLSPPLILSSLTFCFLTSEYIDLHRYTGLYNDPNYLVTSLILGLYICVIGFRQYSKFNKVIVVIIFIFSFYLLLLTQSRGGLISMCVFLGGVIWIIYKNNKNAAIAIILIAFFSSGYFSMAYSDNIKKFTERFDGMTSGKEKSASSRLDQTIAVIEGVQKDPFILLGGIGTGRTTNIYTRPLLNDTYLAIHYSAVDRIHVTPMAVIYENGLPCFIIMTILLWKIFISLIHLHQIVTLSAYTAVLFQSLSIHMLEYLPFWMIISLCTAVILTQKKKDRQKIRLKRYNYL